MIATIFLLQGCSTYGPLQSDPSARGTGFTEERLSENLFRVRYDGRFDQTHEDLRPLLVRRAGEICTGSFELMQYSHELGMVIHSRKTLWPYVTARVKCVAEPVDNVPEMFKSDG